MKYERKRSVTQRQIKTALLELMEEVRFDQITINQIVNMANITRGTFYRYYEDKFQLLENIETQTIEALISASNLNFVTMNNDFSKLVREILEEYQKQFPVLHVLLGVNGDPSFEVKLEKKINELCYQDIPANGIEDEMMQISMTSMWLRTLKFWVFNTDRVSPEDVEKITLKLMKIAAKEFI